MKRKNLIQEITCFVLVFSLAFTQALAQPMEDHYSYDENETLDKIDSVIDFGKTLLGKPYKFVVEGSRVLDCSGFISYIFGRQGLDLPASSASLARLTENIKQSEIKKGDLMFFMGRNRKRNKIGHVAMVTFVDDDLIEIMHASSRGIIVEQYNSNSYYTSRLLFAGRLPQVALLDASSSNVQKIPDALKMVSDHGASNVTQRIDTIPSPPKTIKIIGVGDMMLGTNFPDNSYLPPNDGNDILKPLEAIISKGDVSFGNLEGVILSGEGTVKKCSNPKVCYAFKMPDHYINHFVAAGFNLLSLANNHSRDFGNEGTANTKRILKEAGISHAGLEDCPYTTFEREGIRYGFAAFAPNKGTVKIHDYVNAKKIISHLDSISDIVIISFHGGAEGATMNHITRKTELFLGEDRGNPYAFARIAIDAGADVVLGHGPHVTRAIDIYKGRFIAYSLGNFATYGRFNLSGSKGIAPIVEVEVSTDGTFISGKIHSTKQLGRGGPILDEQNRALKEIQELTLTDIPESILKIAADGSISTKIN